MIPPFDRMVKRLSGGFVLAFHEVPPARFIELVETLSAFRIVPLSELVKRISDGRSANGLFAITVDDGVGETVRSLAGVLRAKGWPGTFYLPTAYIDSGGGMPFQWWRRIAPLLPARPIRHDGQIIDLSPKGALAGLSRRMEREWRTQRPESYMPLLERLIEVASAEGGLTREQLQPAAAITPAEIRALGRNDLIRFESHGISHTAVSSMSPEGIAVEMQASRDRVAELSGHPCRHFCYPFGSPESIGPIAPVIARRFYDSATTMSLGSVDRGSLWLLPRIPLYPENSRIVAECKVVLSRYKKNERQPAARA
jgi:peptidoglycan/xylan/chitin deacetylase (PgdA/CDA1 family)